MHACWAGLVLDVRSRARRRQGETRCRPAGGGGGQGTRRVHPRSGSRQAATVCLRAARSRSRLTSTGLDGSRQTSTGIDTRLLVSRRVCLAPETSFVQATSCRRCRHAGATVEQPTAEPVREHMSCCCLGAVSRVLCPVLREPWTRTQAVVRDGRDWACGCGGVWVRWMTGWQWPGGACLSDCLSPPPVSCLVRREETDSLGKTDRDRARHRHRSGRKATASPKPGNSHAKPTHCALVIVIACVSTLSSATTLS